MRFAEIFERRSGGTKNPKMSEQDIINKIKSYDALGEYYYMSYTMIDKLGINPRSGYSTPIGIYSYPLVNSIVKDIERRGLKGVPYMGEAPYIWLFKPKNNGNGLVIDEYRQRDYVKDRDKLFEFVSKRDSRITSDVFTKIEDYSLSNSMFKFPAGNIWNLSRILSMILVGDHSIKKYTNELLKVGDTVKYNGKIGEIEYVFTDEYSIRYDDGGVNYVSIDDEGLKKYDKAKASIEKEEKLKNMKFKIGDLIRLTNPNATPKNKIVDVDFENDGVIVEPLDPSKSPFLWPFTRLYKANPELAPDVNESVILEYSEKSTKANRASVMWTYLLYKVLGYEYVDDSGGEGVIHGNEPIQAVFFNRSVIEVLEKFDNPASKQNKLQYTATEIFSSNKSVEEIERLDQKMLTQMFRMYVAKKQRLSYNIPEKFKGHIVLNSSKLKAMVILNDFDMLEYFKNVDINTIRIMDKRMLSVISNLEKGNMNDLTVQFIWKYFKTIHDGRWSEGEKALLKKANSDKSATLLIEYISNVKKSRWPEAEEIILKDPKSIPTYASEVLKKRWPEGEQVLSRIDQQRGQWILEQYADSFGINIEQIGKK